MDKNTNTIIAFAALIFSMSITYLIFGIWGVILGAGITLFCLAAYMYYLLTKGMKE